MTAVISVLFIQTLAIAFRWQNKRTINEGVVFIVLFLSTLSFALADSNVAHLHLEEITKKNSGLGRGSSLNVKGLRGTFIGKSVPHSKRIQGEILKVLPLLLPSRVPQEEFSSTEFMPWTFLHP